MDLWYIYPMSEEYIALIGAANIDIQGFSTDKIIARDSNPGKIKFCPGGVSRNIAENLSRLGVKTELLSAIGGDSNGKHIIESCKACGIGIDNAFIFPDERSSVYLAIMDNSNDMAMALSDMAISDSISKELLESRYGILEKAAAIVFDTCLSTGVMDYILTTFRDKPVYVDPVSIGKSKALQPVLAKVHTLKMNRLEAEFLSNMELSTEKEIETALEWFLALGIKRIFITLGSEGVYYSNEQISGKFKPEKADIKNATGAGDAFMAGIVYGTLKGYNSEKIARFASGVSLAALAGESTVNPEMDLEFIGQICGEKFK